TYWSFRLMIGLGLVVLALGLLGLWLTRGGRDPGGRWGRWLWRLGPWAVIAPLAANSFGWIFTEMGRQPWTVFGVLRTADSVSPTVGSGTVFTSLAVFTALYGILAVVELVLIIRFARAGAPQPEPVSATPEEPTGADRPLTFAY
ncbi:MAG TPA: cytochrome ubiquinol oxidase subunit I, partial [Micromonosporaceae bacterium]